jgi:predicted ArsR family transcriptional regulator
MSKRLSRQEKMNIFVVDVINKMFEIAGHDVTYEDIKDREDDWYAQWTMTMEQSDQWKEWGVEEIRKRFRYNKKWAEKEMGMITLMWGLKFSDFK